LAEGKTVRSPLENPKVAEKLNIKTIEGVFDIFGDQSVVAVPLPGHTPGIQALMVKLNNGGRVILCSDILYTMENLDKNILPGVLADPSDILQSFNMLRILRSLNVAIVPSHDPGFYIGKALAPYPMFE
jgi:glyoxylase-like metal-dependent hydrolase (beta-lactamase superfamily II)